MAGTDKKINVALLAMPEVTASSLYGMYDVFSSAGRDWLYITKGVAGEPRMHPYVVSNQTPQFLAANNVWIRPDHGLEDCPPPAIVCIPDFFIVPGEGCSGRFPAEVAWLRKCHAAGATLTSVCTGAVLLAETGLIDGLEAATHWAYIRSLTANYPNVRVRGDQTLIVNGIEQRIVMAGGATSWHDLALFLIARYVGLNEAMEAAKTNLITWHDIGQQPFASLLLTKQNTDAAIAKSQEWLGSHYMRPSPVATLVKRSGLPERSFVRRFTKATGMSPLNYVHALRLEEAKQLLERGVSSVEAIANDVGYEDASFFGRLFHRKVGLTPAQYRRRFGQLRSVLSQSLPNKQMPQQRP
jgi:Transcriptional regulator containing an amidase domain and an AraC-type DNA-binding HTH domain